MKKETNKKQSLGNTILIRGFFATNCIGGSSKTIEENKKQDPN